MNIVISILYKYMQKMSRSKYCTVHKIQYITDFSWLELIEQNMKHTTCIQVRKCQ